jgi:trehalose 6-phosphate phosphatase
VQNVLGARGRAELLRFLETDPLLAFDYDGTLCPIVDHAAQAVMRSRTRSHCSALCLRSICVLVSGRARSDVLGKVDGIPFAQVIGSHGADWAFVRAGDERRRRKVAGWFAQAQKRLSGIEGVEIEDKSLSMTIHYRQARQRAFALDQIARLIAELRGARVIGGKEVFNILTQDEEGKGSALLELKHLFGRKTALYIGDDVTDEEVFELPKRERIFKIRVGRSVRTKADFFVPSQELIDPLLELLVDWRHGVGV